MISRKSIKNLTWIDIENPTTDEIKSIMDEYKLHPIIGDELLKPTLRPKVEEYGDISYLVFHIPTITQTSHGGKQQEVDFVIGKDFLITVHYELIESLHNFRKIFEVNSILDKSVMGDHAGFLFFYMMKSLYHDMALELEILRAHVKEMEDKIFSGNERKMVEALSETAHKVLDFREATRFHKSVLNSFEISSKKNFGDEFVYYSQALTSEFYKVWEILENLRETVIELKKTNDSMLAYKTNETIRILTVVTFITLPLTIIPDIFSTGVIVKGHYNADVIHIVSFVASILLFVVLRRMKWL